MSDSEKKVSNMDLQRKSCRCLIGIEGVKDGKVTRFLPKDFNILSALEVLSSDGLRYYAIIHDKDKTEYKHIHLVLMSSRTLRFKQFFNCLKDAFNCDDANISIRETSNLTKNIQYLVHKNEKDVNKFHYDYSELLSNDDAKNVLDILQSDEDYFDELISSEGLVDIVRFSENPIQIFMKVGYKMFNQNHKVITFLVNQYHPDWIENRSWR